LKRKKTYFNGFASFCKVADLSPIHFRKQAATDSTKPDLNIGVSPGFGGLIQGQIYNPVSPTIMVEWKTHTFWRQATCFFSGPGISPEPE